MSRTLVALALALVAGCTDEPRSLGDVTDDPELPPRGEADLEPWLAAGFYLAWRCEPGPVEVRLGSPHRPATRTCSNALVIGAPAGEFPIGAASVKEMFDADGRIMGLGVSRKLALGAGSSGWYWYERLGDRSPNADGVDQGSCPACHTAAGRDFVYVIAP